VIVQENVYLESGRTFDLTPFMARQKSGIYFILLENDGSNYLIERIVKF
jgi:hypothetical protein